MESETFDLVALLKGFRDGQVYYRDAGEGSVEFQIFADEPDVVDESEDLEEAAPLSGWMSSQSRVAG